MNVFSVFFERTRPASTSPSAGVISRAIAVAHASTRCRPCSTLVGDRGSRRWCCPRASRRGRPLARADADRLLHRARRRSSRRPPRPFVRPRRSPRPSAARSGQRPQPRSAPSRKPHLHSGPAVRLDAVDSPPWPWTASSSDADLGAVERLSTSFTFSGLRWRSRASRIHAPSPTGLGRDLRGLTLRRAQATRREDGLAVFQNNPGFQPDFARRIARAEINLDLV